MFVLNYLELCNATVAADRAGYANAGSQGSRLLKNVSIQAALREGRAEIETSVMVSAKDIARMWLTLATADASDLIQNLHGPCRYCHGIDHAYQWKTPREFREAFTAACYDMFPDLDLRDTAMAGGIQDDRLPTDAGGYGYRITDDPAPDCPECAGTGIEFVRMADTRTLSPAARMLYDGVEVTQNGKKVRVTSREAALERLAKHLGMFAGKVEAETISPLTRLVQRLSGGDQAIPVRAERPEQGPPDIADTPSPLTRRGG